MVNNIDRAQWAEEALQIFAELCMPGDLTEETIADLICDIGHFAELQLKLSRPEIIHIYSVAIGAWSAESRLSFSEPQFNDVVAINIEEA